MTDEEVSRTPLHGGRDSARTGAMENLSERVAEIARRRVVAVEEIKGAGGFTAALRVRARFDDGASAFCKVATDQLTTEWLQMERRVYQALDGARFLPQYIGADDRVLVLEDLSRAHWPPPWRDGDISLALRALEEIASTSAPLGFRELEDGLLLRAWSRVAENPQPFLDLGVCSAAWFDDAIATLVKTDTTPLRGDALVHSDIGGGNLCLLEDRVVVIDWPGAKRGRSDFDVTCLATSVSHEHGPQPDETLPGADPNLVAVLAGCHAYHAPMQFIPGPIREDLSAQLLVLLPWAARLLGLPPPGRARG
jgi:phosphotransferase family enzyme